MEGILPYHLFLYIGVFFLYGAFTVSYSKKHKPPEGTPRWVFWLDGVFVKGIFVLFAASLPAFTTWMWDPDFLEKWADFVMPWLDAGLNICVWGRIILYYYYKFHNRFKKH